MATHTEKLPLILCTCRGSYLVGHSGAPCKVCVAKSMVKACEEQAKVDEQRGVCTPLPPSLPYPEGYELTDAEKTAHIMSKVEQCAITTTTDDNNNNSSNSNTQEDEEWWCHNDPFHVLKCDPGPLLSRCEYCHNYRQFKLE